MDLYLVVKFLHIASVVIWIGGAFVMIVLGTRADRARDDAGIVTIVRQVAWAANHIYVPAAVSTLVWGLTLAWIGNLWGNLWVILGLVGIAITIGVGVLVLTPIAKRVDAGFAAGGVTPAVVSDCREILTHAKFDAVLLFTVIADMVLKPSTSDWLVLLIMAIVLAAAAYVWLLPVLRRSAAVT